jgi:uncharacterized protein (DUF433 family)
MATAKAPLINSSPDVLGGTPVFAGTRVPVQTLIEYLGGGETIDDFLQGFPTVSREQVITFLEEAKTRMLAKASRESSLTSASTDGSPKIFRGMKS